MPIMITAFALCSMNSSMLRWKYLSIYLPLRLNPPGGGGGRGVHQTVSGKPSDQETAKFSFRDLGRISRHSYNSA